MTAIAALGDVADVNPRGQRPSAEESISFVGMANLSAETGVAGPGIERPFREVSKGYTIFKDRDVLVAKITPCFENGKTGQAKLQRPFGVGSTEFHVLRPHSGRLDARYMLHFLRQDRIRVDGERRMTGSAGQRRVPANFLAELHIPLPAIEEQRRIAAILDHADALRAKRRETLDHLADLARSIFRAKFGSSSAEATVESVAAKSKGSIRTGPFGSQLLHSEFVDEGVAVLGLDNVVGNEFSWGGRRFITTEKYAKLNRYTVHPGDVLVSIMGTTGRCVVVPNDVPVAINTKHICAITLDQNLVLPEFVRAAFLWHPASRRHLLQQTKGSIMDGLNMGIVKSMPMPVPSIEIQREFVRASTSVSAQRRTVRTILEMHDRLFASVQSRAFRGEL